MVPALHHRLRLWYIVGFALPVFGVLASWCTYYSLGHNPPGAILPISQTVIGFPENRIFAVSMNMEAIILLLLLLIRNKIIAMVADYRSETHEKPEKKMKVQRICGVITPIALSVLSAVTLEDQKELHLIASGIFFYGCIIYFAVSDRVLTDLGCRPSRCSSSCSMGALVFLISSGICGGISMATPSSSRIVGNIGALCQYAGAFVLFLKVYLCWSDLPEHHIIARKTTM
jgi:hypothetical protein